MVRLSDRVKLNNKHTMVKAGWDYFVITAETGVVYSAKGPGAVLFEAAQVGYSVEHAASVVVSVFANCPPLELIETDLLEFAEFLVTEGVLEIACYN